MSITHDSSVCIAVLNPGGRDPYLDYSTGTERYQGNIHAPINFHAYAAATYGAFYDSTDQVLRDKARYDAVLVLIRRRAWISLEAIKKLKQGGMRVIVAWKECSHNQMSRQLYSVRTLRAYREIQQDADGILSASYAWPPRVGEIKKEDFEAKLKFIPTPYPVDIPSWDFSTPFKERYGIFIGTREFKTEVRNHIHAITRAADLASELEIPRVTVINSDGKRGLSLLRELSKSFRPHTLQVIETRLSYPDYMQLLSSHRLVLQMDRSTVPGQVAGDSLLARTVCVGGSSTNEKIAFPDFCDDGSIHLDTVFEKVRQLLQDDDFYGAAIRKSQEIALEKLSFKAVANQLAEWEIITHKG